MNVSTEPTAGRRSDMSPATPAKERLAGLSPTCSTHLGAYILTLEELVHAADDKRAVVGCVGWLQRPKPAAWVVSMQARMVYRAIEAGMWLVIPKRKRSTKEVVP